MTEKRSLKWKNNNNTVSLILGLRRWQKWPTTSMKISLLRKYRAKPNYIRQAIDKLLWNATGGYYSRSLGTSSFDTMDIAQVLLAEIGSSSAPPKEFLGNLNDLKLPAGYSNGTAFCGHTSCCQSLLYELSLEVVWQWLTKRPLLKVFWMILGAPGTEEMSIIQERSGNMW